MCNHGQNATSGRSSSSSSNVGDLENQLHEQYAVNNNSNATTLIAILSALAIGFAGYGYVVCNYYPYACAEQSLMIFSIIAFLILQKDSFENTNLTVLSIVVFFCSIYTMLIINDKYN